MTHILTVVCNFKEYEFEKIKNPNLYLKELKHLYIKKMLEILFYYTRLLIKQSIVKYLDNDYQKQKFDELFPKVGYHFWLYVYLIQHISEYKVVRDKAELAGINFLHYFGKPKNGFGQYLQTLSAAYNDMYFSPISVERLSENTLQLYLNNNDKFIGIDHSGICRILEDEGKKIKYQSLFLTAKISHSNLKKHRISINCVRLPKNRSV